MGGKKELKMKGSMSLKTAVETSFIQHCVFRWFISKYTLLEPERLYSEVFESNGFSYAYKLMKAREKLYVALQCDYVSSFGLFYLTDCGKRIIEIKALEISNGLYIGHFPESVFLKDGKVKGTNGLLEIAFRFITDYSKSLHYNKVSELGTQNDFDELCHHIRNMFIDSKNADFTFKFENVCIKAHKSVLYFRSKFFEEFFTKDNDATEFSLPDTTPAIMYNVLLYIYSGELCDIRVESMVKILEVAYLLKIPSLKERCIDYFEETNSWEAIENTEFFEYAIEEQ